MKELTQPEANLMLAELVYPEYKIGIVGGTVRCYNHDMDAYIYFNAIHDSNDTIKSLEAFGKHNARMWHHDPDGWSVMVMSDESYKDRFTAQHTNLNVAICTSLCSALTGEQVTIKDEA